MCYIYTHILIKNQSRIFLNFPTYVCAASALTLYTFNKSRAQCACEARCGSVGRCPPFGSLDDVLPPPWPLLSQSLRVGPPPMPLVPPPSLPVAARMPFRSCPCASSVPTRVHVHVEVEECEV